MTFMLFTYFEKLHLVIHSLKGGYGCERLNGRQELGPKNVLRL